MDGEFAQTFDRLSILIGSDGITALAGAHITVFGLGGVGAAACEALARSAVGKFTLVDFDKIGQSNLNRLIISDRNNVGREKMTVMKDRIHSINPLAQVEVYSEFIDEDAYDKIMLRQRPDFCIDAIDSLTPKIQVIRKLIRNRIRFASSMGAGGRLNPLQVRTGPLSEITTCMLASRIRRELKKDNIDTRKIKTVYSLEQGIKPRPSEKEGFRGRARGDQASAMPVPVTFGMALAWIAIARILRKANIIK